MATFVLKPESETRRPFRLKPESAGRFRLKPPEEPEPAPSILERVTKALPEIPATGFEGFTPPETTEAPPSAPAAKPPEPGEPLPVTGFEGLATFEGTETDTPTGRVIGAAFRAVADLVPSAEELKPGEPSPGALGKAAFVATLPLGAAIKGLDLASRVLLSPLVAGSAALLQGMRELGVSEANVERTGKDLGGLLASLPFAGAGARVPRPGEVAAQAKRVIQKPSPKTFEAFLERAESLDSYVSALKSVKDPTLKAEFKARLREEFTRGTEVAERVSRPVERGKALPHERSLIQRPLEAEPLPVEPVPTEVPPEPLRGSVGEAAIAERMQAIAKTTQDIRTSIEPGRVVIFDQEALERGIKRPVGAIPGAGKTLDLVEEVFPEVGAVADVAPGKLVEAIRKDAENATYLRLKESVEAQLAEEAAELQAAEVGFPAQTQEAPENLAASERGAKAGAFATMETVTPTEERAALLSRRELLERVQARLGERAELGPIPIRVGVGRKRMAAGFFRPRAETIRLRFAEDVGVASHEIGHYLDKTLLGGFREKTQAVGRFPAEIRDELAALGKALYGSRKPVGGYRAEGWAELTRMFITEPEVAALKAPKALKWFEETIPKHDPEILAILQEARGNWQKLREASPQARVLSHISIGERKGKRLSLDALYRDFIDKLHPIQQFVEAAAQGKDLAASENPYLLSRLYDARVAAERANVFLTRGTLKFGDLVDAEGKPKLTGPGLQQILAPVLDRLDEYRAYSVAKRTLEKGRQGKKTGIDLADAKQVVDEGAEAFEATFRQHVKWRDSVLQYAADSGLFNKQQLAAMRELNADYVPFFRVMEDLGEPPVERPSGKGGLVPSTVSPVRRFKGSTRTIIDPIESDLGNVFSLVQRAEQNEVMRTIVALGNKTEGGGRWVEGPIPKKLQPIRVNPAEVLEGIVRRLAQEGEDVTGLKEALEGIEGDFAEHLITIFKPSTRIPEPNTVPLWRNGKVEFWRLDPALYEALTTVERPTANLLLKLMEKPARLLRAGATGLNPEFFIAKNPLRDQWTALLQSEYGYIPGIDLGRGLFALAKRGDDYTRFILSGGEHAAIVSMDREGLQETLKDLWKAKSVPQFVIKHPIEALRVVGELTENATRIMEGQKAFQAAIKRGAKPQDALLESGLAAREVTVDFARAGLQTRALNRLVAFLNAQVQGYDRFFRLLKEHPRRTIGRGLLYFTVPSILLYLANRDDPRYTEQPQWMKDLFWIIPTGSMDKKTWQGMSIEQRAQFNREHTVWRIPKAFMPALIFSSVPERILEWMDSEDRSLVDSIGELLARDWFDGAVPTFLIPTAVRSPIENYANWSMFRDRPIVSRGKEELAPALQDTPFTTQTAREIGKLLDYSPAKVENVIAGYSGGGGMMAVRAVDFALELAGRGGPPAPAKTLADIPGIRAVIARFPTSQAESIQRFYDAYEQGREAHRTLKELAEKRRDLTEAREYATKHRDDLLIFELAEPAARVLGDIRRNLDAILRHPDPIITPEQRQHHMEIAALQQIEVAQRALQAITRAKRAVRGERTEETDLEAVTRAVRGANGSGGESAFAVSP